MLTVRPRGGTHPPPCHRRRGAALTALLALSLAWTAAAPPTAQAAEPPRVAEHPLIGQVWDARRGRALSAEQAWAQIAAADYLLLGEVHINPEHHRLQAWILRRLFQAGARPAVAFEMFDRPAQPALDALRAQGAVGADALAQAGGFDRRGWDWAAYRPLVAAALQAGVPVLAANLPRETARRLAREGPAAVLGAERLGPLGLARPLSPARRRALMDRLEEGHCGHLPAGLAEGILAAQRARDALMADTLLTVPRAVLIAGAGHVRRDYAVPYYLALRAPRARVLSVAFVEVRAGVMAAADYLEQGVGGSVYDLYWFTPRYEPEDPCAAFGESLRRLGPAPPGGSEPSAPRR